MPHQRIVLALDTATSGEAKAFASQLLPEVGVLKIGLELFIVAGPEILELGRVHNKPVFLDLKLHDIPATVERAVAAAARHGVRYLTVHASGGSEMLKRAAERAQVASKGKMTLLAVTVLTSMNEKDLRGVGVETPAEDHVLRLAQLAWNAGVRGFVCSPLEVAMLRRALGPDAILVVPGIRPSGVHVGDQKRVATPATAVAEGADLIVVGRPILESKNPIATARAIALEIDIALGARETMRPPE